MPNLGIVLRINNKQIHKFLISVEVKNPRMEYVNE